MRRSFCLSLAPRTFRGSDLRGGANGARISLSPQNNWDLIYPSLFSNTFSVLFPISSSYLISLSYSIFLACNSSVEEASKSSLYNIFFPF